MNDSLPTSNPAQPHIAPSNLGEILDRTAQLYRGRFLVFLGISIVPTALVLVPMGTLFFVLLRFSGSRQGSLNPNTAQALGALFLIVGLLALPFLIAAIALAMAAMNHAASRAYLGEKTTIREAYKAVWKRGLRYLWLLFLEALIIAGVPAAFWFATMVLPAGGVVQEQVVSMAGPAGGVLFGLLVILLLGLTGLYAFWMILVCSLAFPACVVEQIGALPALKRSSALSKGAKGRIFLLYLLGSALTWILSMGITLPVMFITALFPGASSAQQAQTASAIFILVIYGGSFAVQALIRPIYSIALTLFYYDQRIRKEGFDIEWMMQRAGMVPQPPPAPEAEPWLPPVLPVPQSPQPEPPPTPTGESL
jgi:hypothetical protein